MLNVWTTLWSIFGIFFIFSISFTAFAQQEQQAGAALSQSQFMQILNKIDESEDRMRSHIDKKFNELDKKLGELDEKFDELDKQVAVLNTKVNILIAIIVGIFTLIVAPILVLMLRDRLNQRNSVEIAAESREEPDEGIMQRILRDNRPSEPV
jgi:predicted PurR-regulated permease PerM